LAYIERSEEDPMPTATDNRLGELRHRIERLEAKAEAGAAEGKSRMSRYIDTLKEDEQSARGAARDRAAAGEARLEQLRSEVEIGEQRLAAEVAEDRAEFFDAVDAALDSWDAYLERRLASVASASGDARKRAESAIADLRQRRVAVAERLADVRTETGAGWRDAKPRALDGLDELKRKADAAFRNRGGDHGS
jgi:DNA anti-recombination protein RmuC